MEWTGGERGGGGVAHALIERAPRRVAEQCDRSRQAGPGKAAAARGRGRLAPFSLDSVAAKLESRATCVTVAALCLWLRASARPGPRGPGLSTLRGKFTNYCCCIQNQSVRSIYMSIDRCARRDASSSSEVYRDVALVGSDTGVLPILGRWRLSPPRPRRDYYGVVLTTVYIQLLISTTTYCTVSSSRPGRRWRCASRRRCMSLAVSVVGPEYE